MALDGPISAFTSFHSTFCNNGFIYLTEEGTLKICELQPLHSLDNELPIRKHPLKKTPMKIAFDSASETYVMATCVSTTFVLDKEREVSENAVETRKFLLLS